MAEAGIGLVLAPASTTQHPAVAADPAVRVVI
jgi:hypothetical protein